MQTPTRLQIALLALAILIATFFRLYELHHTPPGLHYDEAFDGLEAKHLLRGDGLPIFFEGNFGEEPLSIYLVAGAFALLGETIFNIRLVSALVGIITVPALYLLAKELFRPEEDSLAHLPLLSAFSLAILYWHIHFSRVGIEPILLPLFAVLSSYFLWRGFHTSRFSSFALSGIFLGGSLYTYRAARLLPLLFILLCAYRAVMERGFLRRQSWGVTILFSVAFLIFAPLGYYFLTHPQIFLDREMGLGIFTSGIGNETPLTTLGGNLGKSLALFSLRGDENPRSNLPGRPALDPFLSLAFIVGCGVSIVRGKRPQYAFLLLWLGVMLLPTTLSEYAPHFRRAIGVTPAVALLVALGLARLTDLLERLVRKWSSWTGQAPQWVSISLIAGGLFFSGLITFRDYFLIWGPSNDLFYAFDVGLVDMARYIKGLPSQERLYLSPVRSDHPTLLFLLGGINTKSLDGREGMVLPGDDRATTYLIITHEDETSLPLLQRYLPQGDVAFKSRDRNGGTYFVAYRVPKGGPAVNPERPFSIDLGKVRFLGFDLPTDSPHRGDLLDLTLYWQALGEMKESYTVFTHLLGPYNEVTGSPLWGQDDSLPLRGSYPTTRWEKGEIVVDFYHIPIPPEAPPGEYEIEVGMYLLSTLERLPVLGPGGESDRILLGRIWVEE
ncbi:MAG: ArnT family glycosyltransferase [Anaerolineae bacterium]